MQSNISHISRKDDNFSTQNCYVIHEPESSRYIRLTLAALFLFAAFVGNSIVLRAVSTIRGRKPFVYQLMANLAACELGAVALKPFLFFYEETWFEHGWYFGKALCKIIPSLDSLFYTNITITLAGIAVYRCLMMSTWAPFRVSPFHIKIIFTSIWCVASIMTIPKFFGSNIVPCPVSPEIENCCFVTWDSYNLNIYILVWTVVVQYIPLATMVISYSLVAVKLCKHITNTVNTRSLPESNQESYKTDLGNIGQNKIELETLPPDNFSAQRESKTKNDVIEMEKNVLKMMYLIVFSFVFCYTPYSILFVLFHRGVIRCWKYERIFGAYAIFVLETLPSALHPLFYGTKSKFFAKAFLRLLTCK